MRDNINCQYKCQYNINCLSILIVVCKLHQQRNHFVMETLPNKSHKCKLSIILSFIESKELMILHVLILSVIYFLQWSLLKLFISTIFF